MESRAGIDDGGVADHASTVRTENGTGGSQLAVHSRLNLKLPDAATLAEHFGEKHDLIARHAGALESEVIRPDKVIN